MSDLSVTQGDAVDFAQSAEQLSGAAVMLDQARLKRQEEPAKLVEALEVNLYLWVAIKTIVERSELDIPDALRQNLIRLANYVADVTMKAGVEISESEVDTLVNINLQVCEGLLEARK